MKVLLLGGTGEARRLADLLIAQGVDVVSSLAGRTTNAVLPVGAVRHGGFGGVEGLIAWLRAEQIDALIDATHPFAATMTEHAAEAAQRTGIPLLVLRRPGWTDPAGHAGPGASTPGGPGSGDSRHDASVSGTPSPGARGVWHWVDSAAAAAHLLPQVGTRVFLTIGRQGLAAFSRTGLWTLARCVDPPAVLPDWCTLLLARGPFALESELDLLREHQIDVLVTKDSGGDQTSAKLAAARQLGVPVIVIRRPPLPPGVQAVESVDQVVEWLRARR
ncbi:precorrin-6A/cobalt-precorrin-6A reductase [Kribbella italica]|uniref:Precorrin-6A/cobalt-precorrin-6A reductase n=1 Tax=Kribbella italica TaxID=1540520 RepID=A0A7W9MV69_9ACTN|nr:precorrin-6A/cobalt-precorrin-6A reductase [Kribbella italica]